MAFAISLEALLEATMRQRVGGIVQPEEVWLLMRAIAKTLTIEELAGHAGFETLWAKLRAALMKSFKGQFLTMLQNYDKRLELQDKRLTGRQIAWLLVKEFDIDGNEAAVLKEQEIHELTLIKDNVPKFLG